MDKATEYKNLGNQAFKDQKFQESADYFTKAIEINPNDHVFYSNRSGAYASLKDYSKALEDAQKCVQLKPDWAKGYQRKGLAEFYLGKLDDAIATYNKGLELEPTNQQLNEGLQRARDEKEQQELINGVPGGVGSQFSGNVPPGVDNKFLGGMIAKLQKNPKTREYLNDPSFKQKLMILGSDPSKFFEFSSSDPRLQEALQVMIGGEIDPNLFSNIDSSDSSQPEQPQQQPQQQNVPQQETKKKEEAPKPKEPEVELDEADKKKAQGNEFYKNKDFQKALELYGEAIQLKPTELLYYNNQAACYIEMGNLDKALEICEHALKIKEEHSIYDFEKLAKLYARLGSIYAKKDDLGKSLEWYNKSLIENQVKSVYEECKRIEKLKKIKDEQSYINPELAEQANERGKEAFKGGKYPEAVKEYEEAIKRNPKMAKYYFNRGLSYTKLMSFPDALKDYEKCLELDANYLKAYPKKAECFYVMKQFHKALDFYEKGLQLDPNSVECQQGIQKTQMAIYGNSGSQEEQEQRAKAAMSDPEIQNILRTPEVQGALKAMQNDPKEVQKVLSDPNLAPKIQKLIEAGVLKMGR